MATRKYKKFQTGGYSEFGEETGSGMMDFPSEASEVTSKSETISESKPAKKAPIVTKEELEKSGLSLRDYMNKQQGLTRRGSSSSEAPAPKAAPKAAPKETTVEKTVVKTEPATSSSPSVKKETYRDFSGKTQEKTGPKRPDFGTAIGRGISDFFEGIRERGKKSNPEAYAKGGSVGSASKRADGIAQRGKTRGKIC